MNQIPSRSSQNVDLDLLVRSIRKNHLKCASASRSALEYALNVGTDLLEAKKIVAHGQWSKWLNDNFDFSQSSAITYMRIANSSILREHLETYSQSIANFGLVKAIKLVREQDGKTRAKAKSQAKVPQVTDCGESDDDGFEKIKAAYCDAKIKGQDRFLEWLGGTYDLDIKSNAPKTMRKKLRVPVAQ